VKHVAISEPEGAWGKTRQATMTSNKRLEANRQNALQSTGPKSGEGIEAARFNALRHGLRSLRTVVPGEAPEEWEAHRNGIVDNLKPEALKIGILAMVNTGAGRPFINGGKTVGG